MNQVHAVLGMPPTPAMLEILSSQGIQLKFWAYTNILHGYKISTWCLIQLILWCISHFFKVQAKPDMPWNPTRRSLVKFSLSAVHLLSFTIISHAPTGKKSWLHYWSWDIHSWASRCTVNLHQQQLLRQPPQWISKGGSCKVPWNAVCFE